MYDLKERFGSVMFGVLLCNWHPNSGGVSEFMVTERVLEVVDWCSLLVVYALIVSLVSPYEVSYNLTLS